MDVSSIKKITQSIFEEYGITYAALFGSVARKESTGKSDIDLIVRLGKPMGMIQYLRFIDSLEKATHKHVDVVTEKSINKHLLPYVASDIHVIYEK